MERLTGRDAYGDIVANEEMQIITSRGATNDDLHNIINHLAEKLCEYEDLEEQGNLLRLPCKVGDTVWQIMVVGVQGKNIQYGIFKAVVTKISVDYQMNFLLSTITEDEERYRNEVTSTAIGETMFFTKSKAEAELKKLRDIENRKNINLDNDERM